jgi:hypothetical protein
MKTSTVPRLSDDPVPIAPRHARIVNGEDLTLRWHPVAEALHYRVEIASDPAFDHVVLHRHVPAPLTRLKVICDLPTDASLFYWRVLAVNENGPSFGERIESFVCGTKEQVREAHRDPDAAEPYGPVAALLRATGTEALAEITRRPVFTRTEAALGIDHNPPEAAEVTLLYLLLIAGAGILVLVSLYKLVLLLS